MYNYINAEVEILINEDRQVKSLFAEDTMIMREREREARGGGHRGSYSLIQLIVYYTFIFQFYEPCKSVRIFSFLYEKQLVIMK